MDFMNTHPLRVINMLQTYHEPNYTATNLDYRAINESKIIENVADELITPNFGSYFSQS